MRLSRIVIKNFRNFKLLDVRLGIVFKTPVKPGWRERRMEGTMAA